MHTCKAIVFDLGGIIINVDYSLTVQAFAALGARNMHKIYTQAEQADYVDQFEKGEISAPEFRALLRKNLDGLSRQVTDEQIDNAWNAMLLHYNRGVLDYINALKNNGYIIAVFSNINAIHFNSVLKILEKTASEQLFHTCFHERYFSHECGYNKPDINSFKWLAQDLYYKYSINPSEILFVDDSHKHIYGRPNRAHEEGALSAGWQGICVKQNLSVDELQLNINHHLSTLFVT